MLDKLRASVDHVLTCLSKEAYKDEVKKAFEIYKRPFNHFDLDIDIEHGFNQWLIHDYVTTEKKTFAVILETDPEMSRALADSIFSVFKVITEKHGFVFKDVVTSVDYEVETDCLFEPDDLVHVRLYPYEGKYRILDNPSHYPQSMETSIRQSIMNKYNEYCSANEPIGIDVFVKTNSQLIYHLTNIIHYYENEMLEEQEYKVFVSIYALRNRELVLDLLLDTNHFQIIETFEDEMTLVVLDDEIQVAEALVTSSNIELEANSMTALMLSKDLLEKAAGKEVVFIKENELSIDDLLS